VRRLWRLYFMGPAGCVSPSEKDPGFSFALMRYSFYPTLANLAQGEVGDACTADIDVQAARGIQRRGREGVC
jgi:hypothetical protein